MVESGTLLRCYTPSGVSRVRIPLSPQISFNQFIPKPLRLKKRRGFFLSGNQPRRQLLFTSPEGTQGDSERLFFSSIHLPM